MIARRFEITHRRGFGLVEIVVAAVLFAAILLITVQVVGWAALDRKAAARRDAAAHLVANVMERALARPWAEITTEALAPLAAAHPLGTDPQVAGTLRIEVAPAPAVDGRGQKRITVVVEWPDRVRVAEAPVRLVAFAYEAEGAKP